MTHDELMQRLKKIWSMFPDMNTPYETEAEMLSNTKKLLEYAGACIVREASPTRRGISDLLVCYNGRFIAIELKDRIGETSKHQDKFIEKVQAAGGLAQACRTLSEVWDLLYSALQKEQVD